MKSGISMSLVRVCRFPTVPRRNSCSSQVSLVITVMSLAPQFAGHCYGPVNAPHSLEVYLDYVCPFSAKIYKKLREQILPYIDAEYPNKIKFIFRQQVQPWHPSSTLVHEAGIAVERIDSSKFFEFSDRLFERQKEYFDVSVYKKSRYEIYGQLADLAQSVGVFGEAFLALVSISSDGEALNAGNKVTDDLKLFIKFGRQNGIHVSPTVVWDDIKDDSISSGWELDQWKEYLKEKLAP